MRPVTLFAWLLITPHGDRKRRSSAGSPAGSRRQSDLITPHGDRKRRQERAETALLCTVRHLITPHGDRKLCFPPTERSAPGTHYPSWGSETFQHHGGYRFRHRASLPLMGIGNPLPVAVAADGRRLRRHLITPHGDRKQHVWSPARRRSWALSSLPLMGIGNLTAKQVNPLAQHVVALITPHGDRKPGARERQLRTIEDDDSLPLMGIGNLVARPLPICAYARSTHYPSWGSETQGISLRGGGRCELITPHGDRKPTAALAKRMIRVPLITPHGDRKPYLDRI